MGRRFLFDATRGYRIVVFFIHLSISNLSFEYDQSVNTSSGNPPGALGGQGKSGAFLPQEIRERVSGSEDSSYEAGSLREEACALPTL